MKILKNSEKSQKLRKILKNSTFSLKIQIFPQNLKFSLKIQIFPKNLKKFAIFPKISKKRPKTHFFLPKPTFRPI